MLPKILSILSSFGSVFVVAMMLLAGADIIARYAFNSPIRGCIDLIGVFLVAIVASGTAITTAEDNHIRVDSFFEKLPPSGKKILLIFSNLLSTIILGVFVCQGGIDVLVVMRSGRVTDMLEIPLFPFKLILALGFLLSFFFSIHRLVRLLSKQG